jgi:hypothetical protein
VRVTASALLAMASGVVFVLSIAWAWATFDFWETIPLVPCMLSAGILAGLALYVPRRRPFGALLLGFVVAIMTFTATLLVTLSRWEG